MLIYSRLWTLYAFLLNCANNISYLLISSNSKNEKQLLLNTILYDSSLYLHCNNFEEKERNKKKKATYLQLL